MRITGVGRLKRSGIRVELMQPDSMSAPYVKTNKHDGRDAEAICEAVSPAHHALCVDQDGGTSRSCRPCTGRDRSS